MTLKSNYIQVQQRIQKAVENTGQKQPVDLLAVSKKQALDKVRLLYKLGHRKFGESYVQEALEKMEQCHDLDIQWHFIGPIQSNKTKYLAQSFDWVQSVDSLKILTRLNRQRASSQKPLNVLLQVKVTGEDTKRGMSADELLEIAQCYKDFPNIKIRGIMSIPAPEKDYHKQFEQLKLCANVYNQLKNIIEVDTLSLGMSSDLEAAIDAGSSMVRIGTDIFGVRE